MPGIIVGIDGSDHSKVALEWAMKEAAIRHAPLTVIIVHPVIAGFSGRAVAYPTDDALVDKARETAREEVDKTLAGPGDGHGPGGQWLPGGGSHHRRPGRRHDRRRLAGLRRVQATAAWIGQQPGHPARAMPRRCHPLRGPQLTETATEGAGTVGGSPA